MARKMQTMYEYLGNKMLNLIKRNVLKKQKMDSSQQILEDNE